MAFIQQDLSPLVRGDDWKIRFTLRDRSTKQALDITGSTFWFTMKVHIDDADPGALQTTAVPASAQEALDGIIVISVPKETSINIAAGVNYNYDLQQIDNTGAVQTILIGKVKVVKDVTQAIV